MNISKTPRSLMAAILSVSLAAPGAIWAGGGHRDGGHDRHSGHQDKGYNFKRHGDRGRHYKRYRDRDRHHGRHVTRVYRYGGYHDHHDDDDDDLWIGLAAGGLLGYVIGDAVNQPTYVTRSYQPAVVYPATSGVTSAPAYQGQSCLQQREYQAKVIVGGRQVDAYGTACLQPDGSWLRGPAQVANY
ncbi:MAG: hypothetical protein PVJ66_01445 [Gammaproteobacteria bacterium]